MRQSPNILIERFRRVHPTLGGSPAGTDYGFFVVPFHGQELRVISSGVNSDSGWEHVSVSTGTRIPSWPEMQHIKELFWGDDETVIQFHPRKSEYVNAMPFCLHLWKRTGIEYQLPPKGLLA